jgi:hypothetical protein
MAAKADEPPMKIARFPVRSERMAMLMVEIKANAYGGMVRSWAMAALYPRLRIMEG